MKNIKKIAEEVEAGIPRERVTLKQWWNELPNQKRYFELFAAILTIPVLITVLILNTSNLRGDKGKEPTPTPKQDIIIKEVDQSPQSTVANSCKKEVGPISISYPNEGQEVDDNPVCVIIRHDDEKYCSVVWSYRINGGDWSPYTSNAPCLYNMDSGDVKFELRVQSTASKDQDQLERNFEYTGGNKPPVSPTPEPSPTP